MEKRKEYKTAIGYVRVSTIDQEKGTSLDTQKERIETFCRHSGIPLLEVFEDKSSGKNFNRPAFEKAYEYLKQNKGYIDLFLCMKADRFTRDTQTGLEMIAKIRNLGVEVNYVDEWLDNTNSAQGELMQTMKLIFATYERRLINERTRLGERQALKSGRYIKTPPSGYCMGKINGKACIVPNQKAPLIKQLFEDYATGLYPQSDLIRKYNCKGLNLSKSSISRTLENILYAGFIDLKKFNIEPYTQIKGQHQPIISEELFYQSQAIKTGKNRMQKKVRPKNADFPLSAFMICPICGSPIYGSTSNNGKAKKITREYSFYRCSKNCQGQSYKPELIHKALLKELHSTKPSPEIAELFKRILIDEYKEHQQANITTQKEIEMKLRGIENKQLNLTELRIEGKVQEDIYEKLFEKMKTEQRDLQIQKSKYGEYEKDLDKYVSFGLTLLSNMDVFYDKSPINTKIQLLGSYFTQKLIFENGKFRTLPFNDTIKLIYNYNKELRQSKNKAGSLFLENFPLCTRSGT